jgi:hypothetical protein
MTIPIPDLKEVERRAFRGFYQDGLWDIYFGLLLVCVYLFTLLEGQGVWIRFAAYLVIFGGTYALFWAGRKWITAPRLGQVRFGPQRRVRKIKMVLLLTVSVVVNIALVAVAVLARRDPALQGAWSQAGNWLGWGMGAWIAVLIALLGYWMDFDRLMYYAVFFGGSFTVAEVWRSTFGFLVVGAGMIIIGLVFLLRFLRNHPLPRDMETQ